MATLVEMIGDRLPDEAALFAASVPRRCEEALGLLQTLPEFTGKAEADLTIAQKSLVADMVAKALLLPARSHYKKEMSKIEGDGAGKAEFNDKLKFLAEMEATLDKSIAEKRRLLSIVDSGVAMIVVTDCDI